VVSVSAIWRDSVPVLHQSVQATRTNYDYTQLHIRTYPFQGDGSYSIKGNQLTMSGRGAGNAEHAIVRVGDVNYGGTGWTVRLCMLKTDVEGGKEYEVCYGRQDP
jgi:hypothetical protein